MSKRLYIVLLTFLPLTLAIYLGGCSLGGPDKRISSKPLLPEEIAREFGEAPTEEIAVDELNQGGQYNHAGEENDSEERDEIELIWAVPKTEAEEYVIQYGFKKNRLNKRIVVSTKELQRKKDPINGEVYVYVLKDIPSDKPVYITVSAVINGIKSPPSEVIELMPSSE